MCQLCFVNTQFDGFNKSALYGLLNRDSKFTHKDGVGMFNPVCGVWKSILAASNITNLGWIFRGKVFGGQPVMGHVRNASKGVAVKEENVHPFETDMVVLEHNGTLWFADELKEATVAGESRESDSARFANMLSEQLKLTPNFVEAFNTVMATCHGKFAMIIWVKAEKKFYICRGKTAQLHYAPVLDHNDMEVGFIINTEKAPLEDEWVAFCNTAQLAGSPRLTLGKIELLSLDTIYAVEGLTLREVGKCTENPLPAKPVVTTTAITHTGYTAPTGKPTTGTTTSGLEVDKKSKKLFDRFRDVAEFMSRENLSLTDMDTIFVTLFGLPILSADEWMVERFCQYAIGALGSRHSIRNQINRKFKNTIPVKFYEGLQFPLGLNKYESTVSEKVEEYNEG